MAAFQFTPAFVPTGEPISTVLASALSTLGLSFLSGSSAGKSRKSAERQGDLARQAGEVRDNGERKIRELAAIDPNAPELAAYASFVNQKIAESPGPGDEQSDVLREGDRVLAQVRERVQREQEAARKLQIGDQLTRLGQDFSTSLSSVTESIFKAFQSRDQQMQSRDQRLQDVLAQQEQQIQEALSQRDVGFQETTTGFQAALSDLGTRLSNVRIESALQAKQSGTSQPIFPTAVGIGLVVIVLLVVWLMRKK